MAKIVHGLAIVPITAYLPVLVDKLPLDKIIKVCYNRTTIE